jgi:hypothetical protein
MPVPEQGPVSLFPAPDGEAQPDRQAGGRVNSGQQAPTQGGGKGAQADVAALAERLARSAVGVLEASELEHATQVDFELLDSARKAKVTETFADAIETAAHSVQEEMKAAEKAPAAARQAAPQEQHAPKSGAVPVPPRGNEAQLVAKPEAAAKAPAAPAAEVKTVEVKVEAAAKVEPKAEAASKPEPIDAAVETVHAPAAPAEENPAAPKQAAAPAPFAVQTLAQAQFVGAAQQPVAPQGGALETVVREMLRPLLVQWLSENMPRVLESAIREEIATRGLLPRSDS